MTKTTILIAILSLLFIGCSDSHKQEAQTKEPAKIVKSIKINKVTPVKVAETKKDYTIDEIYNSMCVECHNTDGSGNTEKLTPSMIGQSQKEIENALVEIERDEGHVIMEHNRGEILKMGMEYSAKDMAKYMHHRFSK